MHTRIKQLRKSLGLTQQEFADRIKVKRNTVATYEMGRSIPSDAALSLICKEFDVQEEWLRTGKGEMFSARSRKDELADAINRFLDAPESFKERLVSVLIRLDAADWAVLEKIASGLLAQANETPAQQQARLLREEADAVEQGAGKSLASLSIKDA